MAASCLKVQQMALVIIVLENSVRIVVKKCASSTIFRSVFEQHQQWIVVKTFKPMRLVNDFVLNLVINPKITPPNTFSCTPIFKRAQEKPIHFRQNW